jgi:PRC-barrel domain protein
MLLRIDRILLLAGAVIAIAALRPAVPLGAAEAIGITVLNGASLEHVPRAQLLHLLGKDVLGATGEEMGRIVDVLFDPRGRPRAAVIDFGGFLGVGTRKIAIDWGALHFDMGSKRSVIVLDIGRDQLKDAPEFQDSGKRIAIVGLPQFGPSKPAADKSQ